MAGASAASILRDMLTEFRLWRGAPSPRQRIQARPLDKEVPDPTPVEMPIGYERPPSLAELVQTYVRREVSNQAEKDGLGTFEQEDDFDISEDYEESILFSPYEMTELQLSEEYEAVDASPPETAPEAPEEPSEPSPDEAPAPTESVP